MRLWAKDSHGGNAGDSSVDCERSTASLNGNDGMTVAVAGSSLVGAAARTISGAAPRIRIAAIRAARRARCMTASSLDGTGDPVPAQQGDAIVPSTFQREAATPSAS